MMTDTEIRLKGIQVLTDQLSDVEAERFVALIQREPFDYTKWREGLDEDLSIEEISKNAMKLRKKTEQQLQPDREKLGGARREEGQIFNLEILMRP